VFHNIADLLPGPQSDFNVELPLTFREIGARLLVEYIQLAVRLLQLVQFAFSALQAGKYVIF
jgi:hypothetical protein